MPGVEFNILDPGLDLKRNYFIEASAGTGKTFTIENSVVRLIQEGIPLDQILIVTFTRAATVELKTRIRRNLLDKGLKNELARFDDAKIFTIHGFCFHTLKEYALDSGFTLKQSEESASPEALKAIFKDFLRTDLRSEDFHPKQLERLWKSCQYDLEKLFKEVAQPARGNGVGFSVLHQQIIEEVQKFPYKASELFEELLLHAPKFGKMCDIKKQLKEEIKVGLEKFCMLFEGNFDELFDLPIVKMTPDNLLKSKGPYPEILTPWNQKLIPLLAEVGKTESALNLLRTKFQSFSSYVCRKKDLFFFDDLLKKMHTCVREPSFCEKVRSHYQVALIDEFQDTDQVQWEIFSTLFLGHVPLYLVGDPKQSIYRFRGADLYTYMKAKEAMGEESWATLTHNYRSEPPLIHALNCLFGRAPDLITLPKTGHTISIPTIHAGLSNGEDGEVIFCQSEDEAALFSFIVHEIERLHVTAGVAYKDCAILVKDHQQAKRFCQQCALPFVTKKSGSLLDSEAFPLLQDLMWAAYHPRERSPLIKVLGGPLFRIPLAELEESVHEQMEQFYHYHLTLKNEGLLAFFKAISEKASFPTVEIYLDLQQLVEHIAEHAHHFEDYFSYIAHLQHQDAESDKFKVRAKCHVDAIQVMTLHVSKGLEFGYVFPVGLMGSYDNEDGEESSEKMRQLYVALTRAKKKLYLPITDKENTPIFHFLHKMLRGESLDDFVKKNAHFSLVQCEKKEGSFSKPHSLTSQSAAQLPPLSFPPISIYSYSSLAKKEEPARMHSLPEDEMPAGAETGLLLHRLFEELDFAQKDLESWLALQLKGTFLESWLPTIKRYVENALHYPLQGFCLADVDPKKMRREMEFLYRSEQPPGFIKGFIDLFFEHHGRFYVIDWKSNYLENYGPDALTETVKAYHYDLQAQIYHTTACKFLSLFNAEKQFGGVFFYFLRGLNGQQGTGVYHYGE